MSEKPRRLGRGLEALIGSAATSSAPVPDAPTPSPPQNGLRQIIVAEIKPNPFQPRREFKAQELENLENSLRANGLLQPISVRTSGSGYELIAGERRLRAAIRLGWPQIPAIVKEIDDRAMLTLALVENLQRADLNPVEEAEGYQRLVNEFTLTQQQVADAVGKDRSTIANVLRILGLPIVIRNMLQNGDISLGHARALLAFTNERSMIAAAHEIIARKLSVREVERLAREHGRPRQGEQGVPGRKSGSPVALVQEGAAQGSAEAKRITELLRRHLQTDVELMVDVSERGELRVRFYSADDLQRLLELITGRSDLDI